MTAKRLPAPGPVDTMKKTMSGDHQNIKMMDPPPARRQTGGRPAKTTRR